MNMNITIKIKKEDEGRIMDAYLSYLRGNLIMSSATGRRAEFSYQLRLAEAGTPDKMYMAEWLEATNYKALQH